MHTDNDICTTYFWKRPHMLSSESTATITWTIPEGTPDGTYTIWHYGDYKHIAAGVQSFKGKSGITCLGRTASGAMQPYIWQRQVPSVTCLNAHCMSSRRSVVNMALILQAPSQWVPQASSNAGWLQG